MAMGMRQAWRTLREVDLGAIKAEAEQRFGLVLIGEPRSTAHLAETLSARPGQRGAHPWIVQLPAGDASGLQAALARHEGQPRLALLVTRSVEPGAEAQADLSRLREADPGLLVVQLLAQGFGAGLVALLAYSRAAALLGSGRAGFFGAMVPAAASVLGIPVLGEIPSGLQVAGILAVVLGLGVAFGAVRVLLTRRG